MIKVFLVDDEPLARLRLRQLLGDCVETPCEVAGEAGSAAEALACLAETACDVVLLDIQMPGADGLQLAASLREQWVARGLPPPSVVFVTAHAEHALQAFDLEAIDYLTKPVRRERLQAALMRVEQRLARAAAPPATAGLPAEEPVIVVNDRGRVIRVKLSEVLYLKAELKYVTLRTAQHTYVLDEALSELEQRLGERFLRVHRNALVARPAVRALERRIVAAEGGDEAGEAWVVQLDGAPDEWITVSRRQLGAVREALQAAGL